MIRITIKLLGPFRDCSADAVTGGAEQFEFEPGACLGEVLKRVSLPDGVPRVVLLNGVQRSDDPRLADGDIVTVFPPIAGGCQE